MGTITIDECYILVPKNYGPCWTWKLDSNGYFGNRQQHHSLQAARAALGYSSLALAHFIDPITAISLDLITIPELQGLYPEGFIALLNMLKPQ